MSSAVESERRTRKERLGIAACFVLAFTSLGIAVYETRILLGLLEDGKRADAVVVEIDVGTKGGKKAVFEFTIDSGEQVTSRDLFQMYLIRPDVGEPVTALYDSADPETATIDIGPWIWQEPALLYLGFAFLSVLGILVLRAPSRSK